MKIMKGFMALPHNRYKIKITISNSTNRKILIMELIR
jgi:hypothetical protein